MAHNSYVRLVRRLVGVVGVTLALLPSVAYFFLELVSNAERLGHDARVQARAISNVVTDNPQSWRDATERLAAAIQAVRTAQNHTVVKERSGEELVAVGDGAASWRIYREAPFHDFGAEVGAVVVSQSLQRAVMISALLAVAGLVLCLLLLILLRKNVFDRMDLAENRLQQSNADLRIAAAAFETQEGILVTNAQQVILRVNKAFTRITGLDTHEVVGKTPVVLRSGRHDAQFYRAMWREIADRGHWQGEIWNRRKNSELYPAWLTITAVMGSDGKVAQYVGSFFDISDRIEAEAKIHNLAFYDFLTGLPNRRLLMDRLQQGIVSFERKLICGALLFIDLDNFKSLNDTKGHGTGDQMLVEISKRLRSCVRQEDTVARLGGDEFVIFIENLNEMENQAAVLAERMAVKILAALSLPVELPGFIYHSSASIGIGLLGADAKSADELLKRADTAMYQAKQAGRNAWRFFDPAMQNALEARMALEHDLRQALDRQQFQIHYQKQVDDSGCITGAEVLLRWSHPQRGWISPVQFIGLAEETGLILPIGRWVLEAACNQLRIWQDHPRASDVSLAVNVSAHQFREVDFVEQVREILERTGAPPARLKLELTESVALDNIDTTITKMKALKALGVRFSTDDFGTGHSSLAYLTRLPFDQLKIDKSFVGNIGIKSADAMMVRTIIGLSANLAMDVIAEGVETPAQRDFLIRNGCSAFQGYLFGKPVPLEEFESSLTASSG